MSDHKATAGRPLVAVVAALLADLPPGAALVQLREKDLPARELVALARELLAVTRPRACPLFVNDRLDVALAAGADGVHLPERGLDPAMARAVGGAGLLVGASAHGPAACAALARAGVDIIVCGPIWATPSKAAYGAPLGLDALRDAAAAVADTSARLFAIGGVDGERECALAARAGAHGIAGIRAFFAATEPGRSARALHDAFINAC